MKIGLSAPVLVVRVEVRPQFTQHCSSKVEYIPSLRARGVRRSNDLKDEPFWVFLRCDLGMPFFDLLLESRSVRFYVVVLLLINAV